MDKAIQRVELGGSYPGGLVPKAKPRREGAGQEFERELKQKASDKESQPDQESEDTTASDLHISPLADGDPGSLLDLTA
ncbi:MAG: hypothetical protein ACI8TQ_000588 [Planctomycetota bacterium]|jgi:hypothetical protein